MAAKRDEDTRRATARSARLDLALASVGVGATVVTAASPVAALAALPESVRLLRLAWASWQQDRAHRLLREVFGRGLSEEELTAELSEALESRHVQRTVRQAVSAALDAVGDHVLPALAKLVAEYRAAEREPDAFFRGVCRILQDVSVEEYASLAGLVRALAATEITDEHWPQLNVSKDGDAGECVKVWVSDSSPTRISIPASECNPDLAPRLFHLLDREWFARTKMEGRTTATTYVTLQVGMARRIARILS